MAKRPRRADEWIDRDSLLVVLKASRHDLAIAMSRMQINGPMYLATAELLSAIDAFACVLTDRPDFLHTKPHGSRPPHT